MRRTPSLSGRDELTKQGQEAGPKPAERCGSRGWCGRGGLCPEGCFPGHAKENEAALQLGGAPRMLGKHSHGARLPGPEMAQASEESLDTSAYAGAVRAAWDHLVGF